MIQRIQTIFLILTILCFAALFFVPIAAIKFNGQEYSFTIYGIKSITQGTNNGVSTVPLMALLCVIQFMCLVAIFLYKNRKLQIRFCMLSLLFNLGFLGLIFFHIFTINASETSYSFAIVLPIITLIFLILAYRGIAKDEKLVKSLDRIR